MKTFRSKPTFIAKPPARVQAMAKKYGTLGIINRGDDGNLLKPGYGTFDTYGTESWVAYANTSMTNPSENLVLTYVDNGLGARVELDNTSGDLIEDLTDGTSYEVDMRAMINSGFATINITDGDTNPSVALDAISLTTYTLVILKTLGQVPRLYISNLSSGEVVTIDWYTVREVL